MTHKFWVEHIQWVIILLLTFVSTLNTFSLGFVIYKAQDNFLKKHYRKQKCRCFFLPISQWPLIQFQSKKI